MRVCVNPTCQLPLPAHTKELAKGQRKAVLDVVDGRVHAENIWRPIACMWNPQPTRSAQPLAGWPATNVPPPTEGQKRDAGDIMTQPQRV